MHMAYLMGAAAALVSGALLNGYSCANDPEIPRKITRTIKGVQNHIITSPDVTFYKEYAICD